MSYRACLRCGAHAHPTPLVPEACNDGGLVGGHRFHDLPAPCACDGCGWDDGGELRVTDWWIDAYPPIPKPANSLAVVGDPERGLVTECPECGQGLEPQTVILR